MTFRKEPYKGLSFVKSFYYNLDMGMRKVQFLEGEYYHIYNRGNSKQPIFLDNEDYERFIKLLYLCNSSKNLNFRDNIIKEKLNAFNFDRGDQIIAIGVWVLMPNHFHLCLTIYKGLSFVEPSIDKGKIFVEPNDENTRINNDISRFMKKVCTSYSMYFNKKYSRSGSLFEGKFKSQHASNDLYLKYLFSYIHLNPIKLIQKDWKKNGIKNKEKSLDFLQNYKYSSYLDFLGVKRLENKVLNMQSFPDYFPDKENFQREIFEWLSYGEEIPTKERPL